MADGSPLDALLAYAQSKAIELHAHVRAVHAEAEGYGLVSEQQLGAGEAVLRLPLGGTLSLASTLPPEVAPLLASLDPKHALALLLCITPGLDGWVKSWSPTPQGSWGFCDTPEWEALVEWNREVADRHAECTSSTAAAFDRKIAPFFAEHAQLGAVSLARFSWAVSMVDSRAARVGLFGQERLVLMPLVDLLNHRAAPSCSLGFEPDAGVGGQLVVRTWRTVDPGEQLTISYGAKSNDELISGYGFALASNPSERVALAVPISGEPSLLKQKCAMLPRGTTRENAAGTKEALVSFGWAETSDSGADEPKQVELPAEVWLVLRVAGAADMAEMFAAMSAAGDASEEEEEPPLGIAPAPLPTVSGPYPPSSTAAAWGLLLRACEAQQMAIVAMVLPVTPEAETGPANRAAAAAAAAAATARMELLGATIAAARTALAAGSVL